MTIPVEYSRSVRYSLEDDGWIASCDELPTVSAFGDSKEEALRELEVVLEEASAVYRANGWPLPSPHYAEPPDMPSGEFRLRLPKTLHAQLSARAEREGVSQNALVTYLLAEGLARTARSTTPSKLRRQEVP